MSGQYDDIYNFKDEKDAEQASEAIRKLERVMPNILDVRSARVSSVGGTVRPSAFAVLRLMVNSIVVGCSNTARGSSSPVPIKGTGYWESFSSKVG